MLAEDDFGDALDLYSSLFSFLAVTTLDEAKGALEDSRRGRCLGPFKHRLGHGAVVAVARGSRGFVEIGKKNSGTGTHMAVSVARGLSPSSGPTRQRRLAAWGCRLTSGPPMSAPRSLRAT